MSAVRSPLPIGINLDGVLVHDGLPTPDTPTRLRWVREAGVFDYIEKNIDPREDFAPYPDWVAEHGVPIGVFGGIFCAGRDEALMRWGLRTGGDLGARLFNIQLFARHADGHTLSDREVADWFQDAMEHGAAAGCLPSMEVHVDMWNERFARVEAVGELLARANVPLRLTLDHSHLVFKIGNEDELAASGLAGAADGGRSRLAPGQPHTFYRDWLDRGLGGARAHPQRGAGRAGQCSPAAQRRPARPRHPVPVCGTAGRRLPPRLGRASTHDLAGRGARAAGADEGPPRPNPAADQLRVHPLPRLRRRRALRHLAEQHRLRAVAAGDVAGGVNMPDRTPWLNETSPARTRAITSGRTSLVHASGRTPTEKRFLTDHPSNKS
jgi:hypothetical protein